MILDVLNKIAATDSTNEKLAILKLNANHTNMMDVYRLAYHPRLQYGIKKIPYYDIQSSDTERTLEEALHLLEKVIATRKVTGNAAIAMLTDYLSSLPQADAIIVERIIKRDLECGASATMANKVWKDLIPKQPQMLASSYSEKALSFIKFPAYAQLKADGARSFAEIYGDDVEDVKMYSRAGNEYKGLDNLKKELISRTKAYREVHGAAMVDGELVYIAPSAPKSALESMMGEQDQKAVVLRSESNGIANKSLKGTINQQEAAYMSFQVWDLVPTKSIYDSEKSSSYKVRFEQLESMFEGSQRVLTIENTLVNNIEEAKAIYKNYVEQGLEGIILKNIDSIWENKRSKNLVKFKEELMVDLRIVDVQVHSKDENKLGAVILASDDGKIKVRCGSGFTDTDQIKVNGKWIDIPFEDLDELNRKRLWTLKDQLIGTIAEIKCNGWVAAEGRTSNVSLFLPIIQKLRIDKTETNTFEEAFPDAKFAFQEV